MAIPRPGAAGRPEQEVARFLRSLDHAKSSAGVHCFSMLSRRSTCIGCEPDDQSGGEERDRGASGALAVVLFPNWCSQATSSIPLFPCSHVPIGFPRSLQLSVPMFPMGFPGRNISRVPGGSHVPEQVPSSNFQVADMIGVRVSFASRDVCTSAQKPSTGSINKRNTSKNHHNTLITDGTRTHADSAIQFRQY